MADIEDPRNSGVSRSVYGGHNPISDVGAGALGQLSPIGQEATRRDFGIDARTVNEGAPFGQSKVAFVRLKGSGRVEMYYPSVTGYLRDQIAEVVAFEDLPVPDPKSPDYDEQVAEYEVFREHNLRVTGQGVSSVSDREAREFEDKLARQRHLNRVASTVAEEIEAEVRLLEETIQRQRVAEARLHVLRQEAGVSQTAPSPETPKVAVAPAPVVAPAVAPTPIQEGK